MDDVSTLFFLTDVLYYFDLQRLNSADFEQ